MWAFISLLPDWVKLPAAAALGALVAFGPVYLYGKHEGRQAAAVEAMAASVKALQSRNKIDDQISASDAARLCDDLGLHDDDKAECMRRVAEANAKP
jgi:hypothetical protein